MLAQQPARDRWITPTVGNASMTGIVVNDEDRPQPVRRAIVTLTADELRPSRGAVTDDEGRFAFSRLPAGRYTLTVTRASFVTSVYGAKRPGRPGTPIVLADGATVSDLVVRIWRGAVIAGVVRDEDGEPMPNLTVSAIPARERDVRGLHTLSNNDTTTNDAGEYRIFGLEPGPYLVMTRPSASGGTPLTSLTDRQVDAALDALRRRRAAGATAGVAAPAPDAASPTFAWAPIYFPGTPSIDQATPVVLTAGEERTGIDLTLQRVPTAIVEGIVTRPDGAPAGGATVQLTRVVRPGPFRFGQPEVQAAMADASGRFRIAQVVPGDYRLVARASARPPAQAPPGIVRPGGSDAALWATRDLSVSGQDVSGIQLLVGPGLTIEGRIGFASSATPAVAPPPLQGVRVSLVAPWIMNLKTGTPLNVMGSTNSVAVQTDGSFEFTGLLPDTYVLQVFGSPISRPWTLRSAQLGDRDLTDAATDFATLRVTGLLTITYSDRRSGLSGTLQASSRAASSDVFVLAYTTDQRLWTHRTRRVQAVRPDVQGRYLFEDLPPGDYYVAVLTDVDADEWLDPGFLDALVPASLTLTIAEGEQRVQDLRIGR
jgi:hypothetical protein